MSKNEIVNVPQSLKDEIWDYCRLNSITNIDEFTINLLKQGYAVEKYGTSPILPQIIEKEVEKIVEKIIEVPVEKIVERIIEVPVEKIIEKIITDDSQVKELLVKLETLESDLKLEKEKTTNSELGKLYQKIQNLETLLAVEKNRNKVKIETENPFGDKQKNAINWVGKEDRNKNNLYGE